MSQTMRSEVSSENTWDLTTLFDDFESWRSALEQAKTQLPSLARYQGRLAESPATLAEAFTCYLDCAKRIEAVYVFAHLRSDEDTTNTEHLGAYQQAAKLYATFSAATSFINPELLQIPEQDMESLLSDPALAPFKRMIERVVRYRPHTLSEKEETLLAAGSEVFATSSTVFSQLNNADFDFGEIEVDGKLQALTHGSYSSMLKHTNREVRQKAYEQYYAVFDGHKHSLAATLSSSVKKDVYLAQSKHFSSALEASLFSDDVSPTVYTNLIKTVEDSLPSLHAYYELRRRVSQLPKLRLFDTYTSLVESVDLKHSYEDAVAMICKSLQPLGADYVNVLAAGLSTNRWVDRYENKGKRSGAYSSGCYTSAPYILMNYKESDLRDVYTLTHEAGHSMHSYYSNGAQTYQDSHYTIFVAEVASTFNEQLLTHTLRQTYKDDPLVTAYLLNNQLDDIKSTLFRQTMFADFELFTHSQEEAGNPLTVDTFTEYYRSLLERYFGPAISLEEVDALECFRIPHFYSAFYVYKYATGLAAAVSLSQQVLRGDTGARERYLNFLQSGSSKYPLELLADAGVDMRTPQPITDTIELFTKLTQELAEALEALKS